MATLVFRVPGIPAPQGSKKGYIVNGKVNMVESSAKVGPWRTAVAVIARQQAKTQGWSTTAAGVSVTLCFFLPRPKSLAKSRFDHTKKPDLDKLIRSTFDGIGDAGIIWGDDSQVVRVSASKEYADDGNGALIKITLV
jgi:Holliday junction resolvase RusA-like endonuclease